MGTTLTGTTPANTYDSLIKVTDNGPLSGTAKYLSDGLGNDSKLALSTTQVGVGTTSLSAWSFDAFQVEGASIWSSGNDFGLNSNSYYDGSSYKYRASSAAARMYFDTDGSMFFANAASGTAGNAITFNERLRITSAGNVGIGTSNPLSKLAVQGEIRSNDTGGYAALLASTALGYSILADTHTSGAMTIFTAGSEKMRITSAGNVGIGTSSPDVSLTVKTGASAGISKIYSDGNGAVYSSNGDLQFYTNNSAYAINFFSANKAASLLKITNAGDVGIGTSSPSRKVQIDGGSIASDTPTLRISSTDSSGTNKFGIEFYSNNGADVRGKLLADNNGKVYLDDNGGGGVVLQANGGTGNVGIGTSTPNRKLTVAGDSQFQDIVCSTSIYLGGTAAANALDDYEEGTWTPVITASTTAPTGFVANYIGGSYTKIGRMVVARMGVNVENVGTGGAGTLRVSGLPYASVNVGAYQEPTSAANGGRWVTASNAGNVYAFVGNTTTYLEFRTMASNADTALQYSELKGGTSSVGTWFTLVVTYFVS